MDNGATTMVDPLVVKAMTPFFTKDYGNASSLHSFGVRSREAVESSRKVIADYLGVKAQEIIFTSGGTESDNLAIKGVAFSKGKGHIITSVIEHPAVLNTCESLERQGFKVTYLAVNKDGIVEPSMLEKAITSDTILVSIMHANNEIGSIQPIKELASITHKNGALFHTDAVQSFTKVPINARDADLISLSGHKIHGPKGVGGLYVRGEFRGKVVKQISGGHQEFNLRAGTENIPGAVGFAKAVEVAGVGYIDYIGGLRDYLTEGLLAIPNSHLNGPRGKKRLCNNVNIRFDYVEGESMLLMLDARGIAVSTGSACSSQSLEPSHVLIAMGCAPEESHGSIRLSLGRENTKEEMDYTISSMREVVDRLRKMSPLTKK